MKKLFTLLTVVAISTTMSFSQTEAGTFHIQGDIGDQAWTTWAVSPTVGYFVSDGFVVGTGFEMASGDNAPAGEGMTISPFMRYYLNSSLYAGAGVTMVMPDEGDTETTIKAGLGLSLMWMDRVAVEPGLGLMFGDEVMTVGMTLGIAFRIGME